jgi:hypothetical protein
MIRIFQISLFAILLLGLAGQARGAAPMQQLNIETVLNQNGSVQIAQKLTYNTPVQLEWEVFSNIRKLAVSADGSDIDDSRYSVGKIGNHHVVRAKQLAREWKITYTTTTTLVRNNNRDQIFIKIFQEIPDPIYNVSVSFSLPTNDMTEGLTGNAFAISGVSNPKTTVHNNTVVYSAEYAAPGSLFTVSASWPKRVLSLTKIQEIRLYLTNLEVLPWLTLGILLPIIGLSMLLLLYRRQRLDRVPVTSILDRPPSQLSAMLVGVLVQKKIHPRVIVALLVELCRRGYIVIVERTGQYYLSQRKPFDEHLTSWERNILEELFPDHGKLATEGLQEITDSSLFSPKVRDAFGQVYQIITEQNFFLENPHLTRVKYKLFGLALYFTSAIGLLWVAIVGASPYLSIPLGGTMLVSFLIIRLTPKLVRYSESGIATRRDWISFGNFLGLKEPLPLESTRNHTFELYLPYAIALNKTKEWAERFDRSSTTIIKPDWFITYKESSTTQFVEDITELTDSISKTITTLRGPLVS